MTAVVGIDPSLTGCAVAVFHAGAVDAEIFEHGSKPVGKSIRARARRYEALAAQVVAHVPEGAVVFLEGYAFNKQHSSEALAEFGWALRVALLERQPLAVVEVAASTVKKFAAGKGNANKAAVGSQLTKRFGVAFATDNEADAFGLAVLGRAVLGLWEPETKPQREACAVVQARMQEIETEDGALAARGGAA